MALNGKYLCITLIFVICSLLTIHTSSGPVENYFGVAFSPYVRHGTSPAAPAWDSYSKEEIKKMLRIILTYHNAVSTYSMGVTSGNANGHWYEAGGNCIIARAAAEVNLEKNALALTVTQGIYQSEDDSIRQKEVDNAFLAAQDANRIWEKTVWGLVFTSGYIRDMSTGEKVLKMILSNKKRAENLNLKVGTRIDTCGQIVAGGPSQEILRDIAKVSDFIMCNIHPPGTNNVDEAVQAVSNAYFALKKSFRQYNGKLQVILGETGWASEGPTEWSPADFNTVRNQMDYWHKMREWATYNRVKVHMFEAFDEPWKSGKLGEKHLGWWTRLEDNSELYREKWTNRTFEGKPD